MSQLQKILYGTVCHAATADDTEDYLHSSSRWNEGIVDDSIWQRFTVYTIWCEYLILAIICLTSVADPAPLATALLLHKGWTYRRAGFTDEWKTMTISVSGSTASRRLRQRFSNILEALSNHPSKMDSSSNHPLSSNFENPSRTSSNLKSSTRSNLKLGIRAGLPRTSSYFSNFDKTSIQRQALSFTASQGSPPIPL